MSSTNKTTYYKLSQYIGTDKPTYLGDYNSDMSKIDAGIHEAEDKAVTASQNAGNAIARVGVVEKTVQSQTNAITTLQTDVTGLKESVKTAQNTATEASQKADSAQQTANSALLTANNASSKADNINKDKTLWTGSIKNQTVTLTDSLTNYRFLYIETNEGISPIFPLRNDKNSYCGAQQVISTQGSSVATISIQIKVVDDTHITIYTNTMDHAFGSTHPGLDARTTIGVYGIPR
jgi:hypothetical protein|nr:MAG TPA: major outer membrane lipoprotein [Bacteriophage sp.]